MSFADSFNVKPMQAEHPSQPPGSRTRTPIDPQCMLPGPKHTSRPFDITTVKGTTATGAPAWWCRHDKLVVFDGIQTRGDEKKKHLITRTSKGLEVSRKRSPKEVISIKLSCSHCRDMLGKKTWTYETRVMESKVCQRCQERCWWEVGKQELEAARHEKEEVSKKRDSVLSEIDIGTVQTFEDKKKDLRKVQSDRDLRRVTDHKDRKLEGQDPEEAATYVESTLDLRKVQSDLQLQRGLLKVPDELSSCL